MDAILYERKSKAEILNSIRSERARLDAALARIPDERMAVPGVTGPWSARDLLAHVMVYERWIAAQVEPALRESLPPKEPGVNMHDMEQRNRAFYRQNKDRPLEDLRAEARQVFARLVAAVEAASEETLNAPVEIDAAGNLNPTGWDSPTQPAAWPLWRWIADQTYDHYPEHIAELEAWAAGE